MASLETTTDRNLGPAAVVGGVPGEALKAMLMDARASWADAVLEMEAPRVAREFRVTRPIGRRAQQYDRRSPGKTRLDNSPTSITAQTLATTNQLGRSFVSRGQCGREDVDTAVLSGLAAAIDELTREFFDPRMGEERLTLDQRDGEAQAADCEACFGIHVREPVVRTGHRVNQASFHLRDSDATTHEVLRRLRECFDAQAVDRPGPHVSAPAGVDARVDDDLEPAMRPAEPNVVAESGRGEAEPRASVRGEELPGPLIDREVVHAHGGERGRDLSVAQQAQPSLQVRRSSEAIRTRASFSETMAREGKVRVRRRWNPTWPTRVPRGPPDVQVDSWQARALAATSHRLGRLAAHDMRRR